MKKKKVRLYKKKLTLEDHKNLERSLLKMSKVYRWLRKDEGLSKNNIRKSLDIRMDKIYETFRYSYDELSVAQVVTIVNLLPDKTFFEVMIAIYPDFKKPWYELEDYEEEELIHTINKYENQ